ncbi:MULTISPECIES: NAD(P)-dependent oxidoreductase [unclassified Nocardioides]|uniref:NAD(P)-dependent oxidoreductase n=1 Tax=unclassified Nocardioides TaxID=2615069 RepID=UPI0012E3EA8D|nr:MULTISPECIES: NAD(P)-dependent oxidoreductase [unclassified Nocardioides]
MADAAADRRTIGIVHPGDMGAALGRCFVQRGHRVIWASESRGHRTRHRATRAGLEDVGNLATLVAECDLVISIVPPHAAADVAHTIGHRARVFVDANAISPAQSTQLRALVEGGGGRFVDGSVVGEPPTEGRPVRLFLSGPAAQAAAQVLGGGPVEAITLEGPSAASALKMCYASWTKGNQALLLAGLAAARAHGVESDLLAEWGRSQPDLGTKVHAAANAAARKGWRWAFEMRAVAETFRDAGLPHGFHEAAAWIYERALSGDGPSSGEVTLGDVLDELLPGGDAGAN